MSKLKEFRSIRSDQMTMNLPRDNKLTCEQKVALALGEFTVPGSCEHTLNLFFHFYLSATGICNSGCQGICDQLTGKCLCKAGLEEYRTDNCENGKFMI